MSNFTYIFVEFIHKKAWMKTRFSYTDDPLFLYILYMKFF